MWEISIWMHTSGGIAVGLFGGLIAGLLGVSAGGILVPALAIGLGLEQHRAQAVSLAAQLLPTSLAGVLHYERKGHAVPLSWVAWISVGFLVGAYFGAVLAQFVPAKPLTWLYVAYLLVLALIVAHKGASQAAESILAPTEQHIGSVAGFLAVGAVSGSFSGLLGIGGGLAMTALLVLFFRLSQHQAQALSLAVALLPTGLPAVWVYANSEAGLPWVMAAMVVVGLWIGTNLGARIATRLRERQLRVWFVVLVLLMAGAMVIKSIEVR
jgi:uncharacterized membrane protein YfcA